MRKDFIEIEKHFSSKEEVVAVFHAARFSFEGSDSFVASNSLLDVFLRFGFSVDLLRQISVEGNVDTYAVISAPGHRLEELFGLSRITCRAIGAKSYLFIRKGYAYKVSEDGIANAGRSALRDSAFLDMESYSNPFSALLPYSRKLKKGDYEAVQRTVEKLVG